MQDYLNLEKQYDDLISHVYGKGIHKVQYIELKKYFFAGASTILNILIRSAHEEITDDEGAVVFDSLSQQAHDFVEKMKDEKDDDNDINRG